MAPHRPLLVVIAISVLAVVTATACAGTPAASPTVASSKPAAAAAPTSAPAAPTQAPAAPTAAQAQPTQAPAATSAPEVLKIGVSSMLSGGSLSIGRAFQQFKLLAIDDVNAKGGLKIGNKTYRLEAVTHDDRGAIDGGQSAANKLILSEKVKFIVNTGAAPLTGMQPIAEANNVLVLSSAGSDGSVGTKHPLTFYVSPTYHTRYGALYDWLAKTHPEVKRVMYVASDDATGHPAGDWAETKAKEVGVTQIGKEFYPMDIKDVGALVVRVLRQNPDAIDVGVMAGRSGFHLGFMKGLKEQGYKGLVYGLSADSAPLKDPASEGLTITYLIDWKSAPLSAGEKDIIERYIKKFGENTLEPSAMPGYLEPWLLAQAVVKAGTVDDAAKVAQTLREGEWDAPFGKTRFSGAKTFGLAINPQQPIYITTVKGGSPTTIGSQMGILP